ncbi:MAG: 50S ribosomal protein L6 [Spirochaetales bacterium]|nr:50S ribosomal protein L6 [Spirochaetales bacterium]
MSRIGKAPILIPAGVKVSYKDNEVVVEGPKGKLIQDIHQDIDVKIEDNLAVLTRKNEDKQTGAYHGLYRTLINNMVIGVSTGFSKALLINGVGYRAEAKGSTLLLNLGFSNQIEYMVADGLTVTCEGTNKVIVSGIDKQKVGQASAEIRSLRPPEPYKGKGIRYEDEIVKRKIGKAGIK